MFIRSIFPAGICLYSDNNSGIIGINHSWERTILTVVGPIAQDIIVDIFYVYYFVMKFNQFVNNYRQLLKNITKVLYLISYVYGFVRLNHSTDRSFL